MTKRNETFMFFLNIVLIKKWFFSFFFLKFHMRNANIINMLSLLLAAHTQARMVKDGVLKNTKNHASTRRRREKK